MKRVIKIYCLVIAAIIGAGFSSGKEILAFFDEEIAIGSLNIILSIILFFIAIYLVIYLSYKNNINNYEDFIIYITNKKIGNIINECIRLFVLLIFFTMIAGFGVFINQIIGIPSIIGAISMSIITYITLQYNIEGLMKISTYIVPIIIIGIILLLINQSGCEINTIKNNVYICRKINTYISGIIYTSYNLVVAIPIIVSSSKYIKKKSHIITTSLMISLTLGLLISMIYYVLIINFPNIIYLEIPLLHIAKDIGGLMYIYYILVISFAIYTTTISTAYSFMEKYKENKKHTYNNILAVICMFGILVSNIGFSQLVEYGFSLIGYFGIIQLLLVTKKYLLLKK